MTLGAVHPINTGFAPFHWITVIDNIAGTRARRDALILEYVLTSVTFASRSYGVDPT